MPDSELMGAIHLIPMDLGFKGARDYLQGGDMYDGTMDALQRAAPDFTHGRLRMVIHEFARHQCDLVYTTGPTPCPRPDKARAEVWLSSGVSAWLKETDRPVTQRHPYPEHEVVAGSRIDGQTIVAGPARPFTPIEILVALTKELHLALRGREKRWAFTRLELARPLEGADGQRLQVELVQSLGNRLTRCAVRSGQEPLGYIFFSVV